MSNRVEDLERQVAELQAAVNGLTEELVEMKERVRQLEADREAEAERREAEVAARREADAEATEPSGPTERTTHSDDHTDVVKRTDEGDAAGSGTDPETTESDGADHAAEDDDIVVPEREATTPDAEAAKEEETGEETEDGESGDSDIIVA